MSISFADVLENKVLGKVLDKWNLTYEFEFFDDNSGYYDRFDSQLNEVEHGYSLNDIIKFYVSELENKLSYVEKEDQCEFMLSDLEVMKQSLNQ